MAKKKILYICSEATHGMIPFAANIIRAASESAHLEVFTITVDDHISYKPFFDENQKKNISFLQAPENKRDKYFNKIYAKIIVKKADEICKKHEIDIIHLLTGDYTCNLIISKLKKYGLVFYTVHDLKPHEKSLKTLKDRLFNIYLEYGEKRNITQTNNLVTCSQNQYELLKKIYPEKNVFYHPFPSLITDAIINGDKNCPELHGIDKYILFFGNIGVYKGVELLYNAFKNNRNLSEYKLIIAGCGSIYFPHDNDPRILFINRYIKDEEVRMLFERAACVVYPYLSATQSGVLAFTYKFQIPVLVSDIPFFRECVMENSGLFFKCADMTSLSGQLETLLLKTDIQKMKAAQKDVYETLYSKKALISALEKIYAAT
ncbi:MAG: glycosyltransferase family 4 protein [Tannerella sp.]|jgi:glycosyltransferase involved in cell wall biosynthesis|nr:glycosyltransferase family 4 protein [Tannerella sp.]